MKILVAPLNWGLGHASRCVPLVQRFLDEGHEVILGGDGESLTLLRRHFPKQRYVYLAPLNLKYGSGRRQVWAIIKALPRLVLWAMKDHAMLKAVLREEPMDRVVSDNRFGLYKGKPSAFSRQHSKVECVYMTHQLHIMLPKGWRWAEPIAERLHARIYSRFDQVWVPDYEDNGKSLAREMSHPSHLPFGHLPCTIEFIGPLSRFAGMAVVPNSAAQTYDIVAVLSGLEPQRSLLEKAVIDRYAEKKERVLIVQGLMHRPSTRIMRANITIAPHMDDAALAAVLKSAKHIIARSGYSTVMDLEALGVTDKAEFIPTPGQPEQEYLALLHSKK